MFDNQADEFRDRNPFRVAEDVEPVIATEPEPVVHIGGGAPLLRLAVASAVLGAVLPASPAAVVALVAYNATLSALRRLERGRPEYATPDAGIFAR